MLTTTKSFCHYDGDYTSYWYVKVLVVVMLLVVACAIDVYEKVIDTVFHPTNVGGLYWNLVKSLLAADEMLRLEVMSC